MEKSLKNLLFIGLIMGSFVFGISSGYYKHFPFSLLKKLKSGSSIDTNFHLDGRNFNVGYFTLKDTNPTKKTMVFLTYGQSNSVNGGDCCYNVTEDVFMYLTGQTYRYQDPSLGVNGLGGSVWGMVGDKLIKKGVTEQVVFSNCGWGGKTIKQLSQGHNLNFLVENYRGLIKKFGKVDGILFHQGENNNSPEGIQNYYRDFSNFIKNLNSEGVTIPIYLSRVSLCGSKKPINPKLTNIQNELINNFNIVREGPNTDLISKRPERTKDLCHFTLDGYDRFSDMWIESLTK